MAMHPAVTHTPYAMSSKEQTGDVITFTQFEEWNILTETRNNAEISDKSNSESIMMSKQDMEISIPVMSQIMISYLRRCYKTFVTEVRPIQMLIKGKHVRKYVTVLGKGNRNRK